MQLYIVRHGEKANIKPGYNGGWNPPLTRVGTRQAKQAGERLSNTQFDAVYSSCLLRSLQTAEQIHRYLDCDWHVWPVFCESSNEVWSERRQQEPDRAMQLAAWQTDKSVNASSESEPNGKHGNYYQLSDITEKFPDVTLTQPFPWPEAWWVPGEGQTRSMGYVRAELGVRALIDRHGEDECVAIVCHGNIGDKILTTLMDFPRHQQSRRFDFDYTGIARVDRNEDTWKIRYLNRTSHLAEDLTT